jgi:Transposase DDE domain group 1
MTPPTPRTAASSAAWSTPITTAAGVRPTVVFDGQGRSVTALLRPAKRPNGREIRAVPRRLIRAIRRNRGRGRGSRCAPRRRAPCLPRGAGLVRGARHRPRLRPGLDHHAPASCHPRAEASTAARLEAAPHRGKVRRFKEFHDGAGTRVRRIVARVEAGPQGGDTRFIVTDLCAMARGGSPARVRTASVAGPGTT